MPTVELKTFTVMDLLTHLWIFPSPDYNGLYLFSHTAKTEGKRGKSLHQEKKGEAEYIQIEVDEGVVSIWFV